MKEKRRYVMVNKITSKLCAKSCDCARCRLKMNSMALSLVVSCLIDDGELAFEDQGVLFMQDSPYTSKGT
jgi:hypothetical protein